MAVLDRHRVRHALRCDVRCPGARRSGSDCLACREPKHLVRTLEPSTSDIINGQRLGLLAVGAAMAGYTDCVISQRRTEFAIVPLDLVVLGRKRIAAEGMFWESVVSKTGQEPDLVDPYPWRPAGSR